MKRKFQFQKWIKQFLLLSFCFVLLLYTMTFPSNTSWFILIFFAFLFLALFFSTVFSWEKLSVSLLNETDGTMNIEINAKTRIRLPIFLPSLLLQIQIKNEISEVEIPVYFQNQIHALFENIHLPRGHFTEVKLFTYGRDHFGIFSHYSKRKVPTDIYIYPHRLSKQKSNHLFQKIYSHPLLHQYLSIHSPQFHQIREYQSQDLIKQVDWKTSMRKKKMMVKEFENEIIPTLTIIFVGIESEYFEQLLSLSYTLYLDLQNLIPLKLLLIGNIEGKVSAKNILSFFVTIESDSNIDSIIEVYNAHPIQTGYKMVIAPEKIRESLHADSKKNFIYLSEKDLSLPEVNK